jgi:hypothetical protein
MEQVADENDVVYDTYGLDIVSIFRYIYEKLLGQDWDGFMDLISFLWNVYSIIAIILALLFFAGFVYAKIRYGELSALEEEAFHESEHKWAERYGGAHPTEGRWTEIQKHLHDDNPNSWKIAIIEADIYLEEVLNEAGYVGVTLGEKLKSANPASFTTLQDAWEAHKIRNEIAHAGGDFILTKRVAQETLVRYERVFHEFGVL